MQNWNQWHLSAGAVTNPVPQPPVGYTADPMALMQTYMQYYNQPTPTGYTPEQWAAAQQQGWAQWQQWQQQYQQWQTQYGEKYQETMKHLSAQNVNLASQTQLPLHMQHPPLPKDDVKPPLPPTTNTYQFANMPPPHQNDLPLFPSKEPVNKIVSQTIVSNHPSNPPLPTTSQPPLPPEIGESRENISMDKRDSNTISELDSAKKLKFEEEEISEAEKTFDAQFKQWEEQFNKWKQQNANHPDKTQYKQYEAKWTSWREKLLERREQMRKKREQQKQAAAKAEIEKNNTSGDDKILNILSNTENQRLVNNLLGIGKTLGLTGKQNTIVPLPSPPPPPPPPETTNSNNQTASITQGMQQAPMQVNMMRSNTTSSWPNQQWGTQYNPKMQTSGYPNVPAMSLASFGHVPSQIIPANFAQPPPNLLNVTPNFSQPPPNFHNNDYSQSQNVRVPGPLNMQDKPSFGSSVPPTADIRFMHPNDHSAHNFDEQSNIKRGEQERFGRENSNPKLNEQQNQFRSIDAFGMRNDSYNDRMPEAQHFRRDDRNDFGNNQLNVQNNFNLGNDRFGIGDRADTDRFSGGSNRFGSMGNERLMSGNDRFVPTNDRFGPGSERFGSESDRFKSGMDRSGIDKNHPGAGNDRFGLGNDRFGPGNDRFGADKDRFGTDRFVSGIDRFGPGNDRFGLANDRFGSNDRFPVPSTDRIVLGNDPKDRFSSGNDRFTLNNEHFSRNDRFGRDCFESKDPADHRRDSIGNNSRSFNRDHQFSPPNELSPELKKLMEKRKAAVDVFKPSFLDSEKTSTVGSLSESFKKITGESLFKSSLDFGQKNLSPHGSGNFPNSGLSNFQPHSSSDIGHASSPTYSSRNLAFNQRDNESFTFRGKQENFIKDSYNSNVEYDEQLEKDVESRQSHQSQLVNMQTESSIKSSSSTIDATQKNNIKDVKNETESMQVNELEDNIIQKDFSISEEGLSKKGNNEKENKLDNNDSLQSVKDRNVDQTQRNNEKKDNSNNDISQLFKKSESLPFMGDNDPPGEDLNIEPPPELPNLGSVSTDSAINNESFNQNRTSDEKLDGKAVVASQFDVHLGPKNTEFKSNAPLGPRDSSGFGPKNSDMFPAVSNLNTFPLPFSTDVRLAPQVSKDEQFVSNDPSDQRFNLRRASDEQYDARNRNNEQIGDIRLGNQTGQLGSRESMNERLGSRSFNDNQFGPGGSINRQMRPLFAMQNSGPFETRSNDTQFAPRVPADRFDSRVLSEGGPQGSIDGSRGFKAHNDMPVGIRRSTEASFRNEVPFDKRPLDNSGSSGFSGDQSLRRVSESPFGSRVFNDQTHSSRTPGDMFSSKDNIFGSRTVNDNRYNDTHFGPLEFKDKPFLTKRSMDDVNNPAWSVGDGNFFRNNEYQRNSYLRRGQFEDSSAAKIGRFDSPKAEEFNKSYFDRSIEMNMRKDNANEYDRHIPYDLHKKDLDENVSRSGYGINDTWKQTRFSNIDQRPDDNQCNIDKNMPATFDERLKLERNTIESKKGDFRPGYAEPSTSSDFQSKYGSNTFMKRPLDSRQFPLGGNQEFCVQKQFNYNHGEIDKKHIEHVPAKVIDYAHMSRSSIMDRLSPVQCFDYGHGDLKPIVPDCKQQPKKDFRNWVENEQNLKEYTEKMENYEKYATGDDIKRPTVQNKRKDNDWLLNNKKFERDRQEKEDYKEKIHTTEERDFGNDQNDRYQSDKSTYKELTQEICDNSRREINKDNNKHDNRSKGNVNWQENSNKNIVDTKSQDTSLSDIKKNVESTSKILELAKMQNYTMVDDLLCPPGRQNRPPKITIILRGPPGSGKSFVAKLIKDKEVEQGGSAPRILSLDDYFLVEKEIESKDDNEKKITIKEMVYEYEEAMEQSYIASLVKAFKKNIIDGFFNFIILDCINEKISDYEEMWSFAKTKGFKVYVCEMEMDLQICLKRNVHNRTEDEINHIIDYFEPTPSYHHKLDVNSMLQEQAIEEVDMEDSQEVQEEEPIAQNEDSQDSQEDIQEKIGVSKWEKMEAEDKLNRLDGLAKKKNEGKPQTMEDFLQVPDYYNMEDTSGKKRVRWADLEERKEQEKMRAVGFVVGHTNWDRMMDPTKGGSALTRTKYI